MRCVTRRLVWSGGAAAVTTSWSAKAQTAAQRYNVPGQTYPIHEDVSGRYDVTWQSNNPSIVCDIGIYQTQLAQLDSTHPTFSTWPNGPSDFWHRVHDQGSVYSPGYNPPYAPGDVETFVYGYNINSTDNTVTIVFTKGAQPTLQSLNIIFDTHNNDKDQNTDISSTFETAGGEVLASFYMTGDAIQTSGSATGPSGVVNQQYFPLGQPTEYQMKLTRAITPSDVSGAVLKIYIHPGRGITQAHNQWTFRCSLRYSWSDGQNSVTPPQEWGLSQNGKNGQLPYNIRP